MKNLILTIFLLLPLSLVAQSNTNGLQSLIPTKHTTNLKGDEITISSNGDAVFLGNDEHNVILAVNKDDKIICFLEGSEWLIVVTENYFYISIDHKKFLFAVEDMKDLDYYLKTRNKKTFIELI